MNKKIFTTIFASLLALAFAHGGSKSNSNSPGEKTSPEKAPSIEKIDVWDFGAKQLDEELYNNHLTVEIINAWYAGSITPGSSGNVFPSSFSAGLLIWTGGTNDRLRTTNTEITRYDQNTSGTEEYTGRLYINGAAATGRYLSFNLDEDDEVTLITKTDAGGKIVFKYTTDPVSQTDEVELSSNIEEHNFVAKSAGTYQVYDKVGKPSYFRIYRKKANYISLTGAVDLSLAPEIPAGYAIAFKNEAGKIWQAAVTDGSYSIDLPSGYTYELSVVDASSYIISEGETVTLTEATTSHNIALQLMEIYTVTGDILGLNTEISKLTLIFTPNPEDDKTFVPETKINTATSTYSVKLEPACEYTISAKGVNDYFITANTITIGAADKTANITFEPKPLHAITINTTGLSTEEATALGLTFTNLYEEGYSYTFANTNSISLRNGTYTIKERGLNDYPLELGLTSNLVVEDAATSKDLVFKPVTNWPFNDQMISNGTPSYKGLIFTGNISNEIAKGHLVAKPGATIKVPVNVGEKIVVTYYYSADFSINGGDAVITSSGSTNTFENTEYIYEGSEAGEVTITIGSGAGSTYITNIAVKNVAPYQAELFVGEEKPYQTINAALNAVRQMIRANNERVTIVIDAGNYEEMLVVDVPNVTLRNASVTPSINLVNKGVDIEAGAVRITSYYGHGYNYYSMNNDQKWNAEALRVNKENGYTTYDNKGAGTTNGSYWNATVVISANGFEAENIIFENSFNQYISKKESEDVVEVWESGGKGERPTDVGNTAVQDKSFVERAAAMAITNNTDKVVLNNCRIVGRQDSFFGGVNTRVVVYKGAVMGGTDYIFGGMTAVFYKTNLLMNTSATSTDVSYITAAQQSSGRGYLMYECNITSATPGIDNASTHMSKPGCFGRPWQANTSEVVFYNTTIGVTNFPGSEGKSFIIPVGWLNSLGGESPFMHEYGTIELSGENNQSARAPWSTLLTEPKLSDNTAITTFNFTKGNDDWDPIPALIENDVTVGIAPNKANSEVVISVWENSVHLSNITSKTTINVYNVNGSLVQSITTNSNTKLNVDKGLSIVEVISESGRKVVKVAVK
ncbi:MAG TPA: pectinesterase family protein [Marinilabiliaceae bacterium]|nr:pectinesterase family protein [Marinilabiliaceae bacterium]